MRSRQLKIWAAALTAFVMVLATVGVVYAYLSSQSGSLTNDFTPATEANPTVSGYSITIPSSGYAVYVRAAIVVTWQKTVDGEVHVYGQMPEYTIQWDETNWFLHDGFYYLKNMTTAQAVPLISDVKAVGTAPEGYDLHVEIIAQTIQALGTTDPTDPTYPSGKPAVTDAWGIEVDSEGELIDPTT